MDLSQRNVIDFIDELNKQRSLDESYNKINNDPEIKLRKLRETKRRGINDCMNAIMMKICQGSLPEINGREVGIQDLDKVTSDFISRRTGGKDYEFYVREAIKRNPKNTSVIRNVFESVERIVNEKYADKCMNPDTITDEDYKFNITPDVEDKLSAVIRDNNLDDLAEVIKDNVRNTVVAEVELAKKEKEERKALEEELTNDDTITTESALEEALRARGMNKTSIYTPSLFEAVMINKFNQIPVTESVGDVEFISEDCYVTEGVVTKIKAVFKAKAEADAKETIAKNHPTFLATIEEFYKTLYSNYRSKISPINVKKITKMVQTILADSSTGDVTFTSKVNLSAVKDAGKAYRDKVKTLMTEKTVERFVVPKETKTYTGTEAMAELTSAVNALDSFFSKPDVKSYVNKASSYVTVKANKCDNPKDVIKVYDLAIEYYVAELAYYAQAIDFAIAAVEFAKGLISKYDKTDVKESAFDSAIKEFTLLNISKSLYLESFSLMDIPALVREYTNN